MSNEKTNYRTNIHDDSKIVLNINGKNSNPQYRNKKPRGELGGVHCLSCAKVAPVQFPAGALSSPFGSADTFRTTTTFVASPAAIFTREKFKETACGKNGAMASHKLLICQWQKALKSLISGAERGLRACYPSSHIFRVLRLTIYDFGLRRLIDEGKVCLVSFSTDGSGFAAIRFVGFKSERFLVRLEMTAM